MPAYRQPALPAANLVFTRYTGAARWRRTAKPVTAGIPHNGVGRAAGPTAIFVIRARMCPSRREWLATKLATISPSRLFLNVLASNGE